MKKIEIKIEDVKKYLELADKVSYEIFQKKMNKKEKDSEHWRGRWNSYMDLLYLILGREEARNHLRLDKKENINDE